MSMSRLLVALVMAGTFLVPGTVLAHPGKLDKNLCHICKTRDCKKWGVMYNEFHCHGTKPDMQRKALKKTKTPKASILNR